jgi:hypothetical protein
MPFFCFEIRGITKGTSDYVQLVSPGLPFTAETADLLNKWAGDHGIKEENLSTLTPEELESAVQALQMLAYWLSAPIKSDLTNPFWLENEGFNEADRETDILRGLEEKLRKRSIQSPGPREAKMLSLKEGSLRLH